MNICAPGKYDSKNKTCFTLDQLVEMAKAYNRYNTKRNLTSKKQKFDFIKIKQDKSYLLHQLHSKFMDVCDRDDDVCITKQHFMIEIQREMNDDILTNTFRTDGPDKSTEWLTTIHINNILSQYEKINPDFVFMGAVPLDCNELDFCPLYRINYDNLIAHQKYKIGVIFNHDKFGEPGSHWVALYIDINAGEANFCDSSGRGPIKNISAVLSNFGSWHNSKYNKVPTIRINKTGYQLDSSECGVYSCNFIIQRLAGKTFKQITSKPLNFKQINSCRNVYFKNGASKYSVYEMCDPIKNT